MRALLAALAVACTLLLGVIAYELWPIARLAATLVPGPTPTAETRAQRNERLTRETIESNKDMEAILRATFGEKPRPKSSALPPSTKTDH